MGIYRTLLEEEVPHLDDNNNPDEQIKELQDVIEDQDANQAEQDAAQDAAYGPDCGVDDIMDESAMAIYEFEAGHAQIMQAIGMHEMHEATVGREFIFEAADIKGFFKSVKDKIVAFFKKVWSVLQRWAGNIGAVFTSNKKFADKYGSAMEAGHKIVSGDKSKEMKMYPFSGVDGAINFAKTAKTECTGFDDDIAKVRRSTESGNVSKDDATTAEQFEERLNKYRGDLAGESSVSAGEFSAKLKSHLYGEEKKGFMDVAAVKAILSGKKDDRKAVADFMKEYKNQFNKTMKSVNDLEKAASKVSGEGTSRNAVMAEASRLVTFMRTWLTATQTWRSATLSAINARARQARRFGMLYVTASNKDKHKGFQKESAEYGFLGSLGLV